jgi:hypothetical protein
MSDPIDRVYLQQTYDGTRELALELTREHHIKSISREDLERKVELLAWRFKSLDDTIKRDKELPEAWKKPINS